ncbi:MAG: lipid II:glycine glycyltransferase FemX [Bacteroidota bacterium]
MITDVHPKPTGQLFRTPIVQQTAFWSQVKENLGNTTLALNYKTDYPAITGPSAQSGWVESDLLITLRKPDRYHSVAYVPYGPEFEPAEEEQGRFLEELSESIRSFLPSDCIMIRYDLCWESYWAKSESDFDVDGNWLGEPDLYAREMRFNFNTVNWNFHKSYHNILPSNTVFVDLRRDLPEILLSMKPKTRYNIHLAVRKGIHVKTLGIDQIHVWYELYLETAARNRLYVHDLKYFEAVLAARELDAEDPAGVFLLVAEWENIPLAAMFLIVTGNRGSYLYGASSSAHRQLMAPYALQWEAIRISKQMGCTEYDMFGVSPNPDPMHPMYGLYRFKTGFGGNIFHSLGCWDYPFMDDQYNWFRTSEMNSQGYHLS